jgi:hypothetical protein
VTAGLEAFVETEPSVAMHVHPPEGGRTVRMPRRPMKAGCLDLQSATGRLGADVRLARLVSDVGGTRLA